jgi:hypothetical protein
MGKWIMMSAAQEETPQSPRIGGARGGSERIRVKKKMVDRLNILKEQPAYPLRTDNRPLVRWDHPQRSSRSLLLLCSDSNHINS